MSVGQIWLTIFNYWGLPGLTIRSDESDRREIGAVSGHVPGQKPVPTDRSMRADIEVRERGSSLAAAPAVGQESLARHEGRLER